MFWVKVPKMSSVIEISLPTMLVEPFVFNERLCRDCVNFLLSRRKVSLWLMSPFSLSQFAHTSHTPSVPYKSSYFYENVFLFQVLRKRFMRQVHVGCPLVFLFSSMERFCEYKSNFANMSIQLESNMYHKSALFLTTAQS